jgi:hypothetical protein
MTSEIVLRMDHHTEILLKGLRTRTPKVLIVPMSRLVGVQGMATSYHTLEKEDRGVDAERLM